VFLPGDRVLAFAPDQPIALTGLLQAPTVGTGSWQPLPEVPQLADRLTNVVLNRPPPGVEEILSPGGEGIGVEELDSPHDGVVPRTTAGMKQGVGNLLAWLGQTLGWKQLADAGANMAQSAREFLQRVSADLQERQEAVLRELLRKFQAGDLDAALRRALPLGESGGRGSQLDPGAELPTHQLRYSLNDLRGSTPGRIWQGGAEVMAQLTTEYRKAAEAATTRGDYRRAAFIYGKLLRDYRLAAAVLSKGGLHHDAAILYLEKLNDEPSAARCFEAAGAFDQALAIYRRRGSHLEAGDLLHKLGDEEQSRLEYRACIQDQQHKGKFHVAGELALEKLHDRDLAMACYRDGWDKRPTGSVLPCLMGLTSVLADGPHPAELWPLLDEATPFLEQHAVETDLATFYQELAKMAERPHLSGLRDALRDRALLGLAMRLRQRADREKRPGNLISTLLGQSNLWNPAVVQDANLAYKSVFEKRPSEKPVASRQVKMEWIHTGKVCAACVARKTGKLFVGFQDGHVYSFDPKTGNSVSIAKLDCVPSQLQTDQTGSMVVALVQASDGQGVLHCYQDPPGQEKVPFSQIPIHGLLHEANLSPILDDGISHFTMIWDDQQLIFLTALVQVERSPVPFPFQGIIPNAPYFGFLLIDEDTATIFVPSEKSGPGDSIPLGWNVRAAMDSLSGQHITWSPFEKVLDVDILRLSAADGSIAWSRLWVRADKLEYQGCATSKDWGYLATTLLPERQIAAVGEGGVDWLRIHGRKLVVASSTVMSLSGAIGCFYSPPGNELLIVCRDGCLLRVSVPH
jgi:tetratricopeptide (TPR) repeat protein